MTRLAPWAAAAFFLVLLYGDRSPGRSFAETPRVERLLENPERLGFSLLAEPAAAFESGPQPAHRWSAQQVAASWSREESATHVTLRSPWLGIENLESLEGILIRFAELGKMRRFTLLWNDAPRLSESDSLQRNREITAHGDPPPKTFLIKGEDLLDIQFLGSQADEIPMNYLFLRFPAGEGEPVLNFVGIVTKKDLFSSRPYGSHRLAQGGEIRNVAYRKGPGSITYATSLDEESELVFGLSSLDRDSVLQVSVSAELDAFSKRVFQHRLENRAGGFQDFRVKVPALTSSRRDRPLQRLRLSVDSGRADGVVFWANPMLIRRERSGSSPNIVLYVVDTLRADYGAVGGGEATPFLADLAGRGVSFRNAYAQASWTKPSLVTLLTSLYPQTHGVGAQSYLDVLPESVPTLQDYLAGQGYVTGVVSANPMSSTLSNLDQGFDYVYTSNAFTRSLDGGRRKTHSDDLNEVVFPWIEAHAGDPFFLYIHSIDAHPPFCPAGTPRHPRGGSSEQALYRAEIGFNDEQIRRLHQKLRELGLEAKRSSS